MASLHTISNCINNPHRKYRKFCIKQQPEETQFIQECLWSITQRKQQLPTVCNSWQSLVGVSKKYISQLYQPPILYSMIITRNHTKIENRKTFNFIDVNVTSYNRKLRGRFPYKVILSNQTEPLFTSWNPNDVNTELSRTIS